MVFRKSNTLKKGFTLMELVLVMVVISILVTGTVVGYRHFILRSKDSVVNIDLKSIDSTIDFIKEKEGTLPTIAGVKEELDSTMYKFDLERALISTIEGQQYITIRANTTQLSEYGTPYSLNVIAEYNDEFGVKLDGEEVDTTTNKNGLLDFTRENITMIILDNTSSGVPEIYWVN